MFKANVAVFVGKDRTSGFRDYIADEGFFFMVEVADGMTKTEGHAFMKDVKRLKDEKGDIQSLSDLEVWMTGLSRIKDIPEHFSAAAGILVDDVVYVETIGQGEVHLRRGKDFVRLIHGDKSASGYIKEGDMFVFTTKTFRALIEEEEKLEEPMDKAVPADLVLALEDYFDKKDDQGSSSIFVQFSQKGAVAVVGTGKDIEDEAGRMGFNDTGVKHTPEYHKRAVEATEVEEDEFIGPEPPAAELPSRRRGLPIMELPEEGPAPKESIFSKLKFSLPQSRLPKSTSKMITIVAVVVIAIIFIWSVVFGYQRRRAAEIQKKIQAIEMDVDKKVAQADEEAFLNLDHAVALLADAKKEVSGLQKEIGNSHAAEISKMNKKIADKENAIMHKDEKEPEEFYDLALENKDATGTVMYLEKERIAVLDTENKTIYNLSAEKKSIEKSKNNILSSATKVGMVNGVLFAFVPGQGLYQFTDDTKVKKVIDNDKDWGDIADLAYFSGNVYMLDSGKKDVLKYTLITNGYAPKTSYFKGDKPDLSDARSIKIDSSVYISLTDTILKYTRGEADEFKVTFPTSKVDLEKIYTDEEASKVYAWDKTNAAIYVLGKDGTYEKQIKASILAKATDFIVYKNDILVLAGSKIYKLTN